MHGIMYMYMYYRGSSFRKEFANLGDLRGFFPTSTCLRMVALTATATEQTRKEIFKLLGLKKPSLVLKSPDKPNITYHVCDKLDIENVFNALAEEVCIK